MLVNGINRQDAADDPTFGVASRYVIAFPALVLGEASRFAGFSKASGCILV
jgi:hypothetical protein